MEGLTTEEAVVHGSGVHLATAIGELDSSRVWEKYRNPPRTHHGTGQEQ